MGDFIMMIGVPGSGKSTIARKLATKENTVIVSSDDIREFYFGGEYSKETNRDVFLYAEMLIHEALRNGQDIIFDATNLSKKYRKNYIDMVKEYGYITIAKVVVRNIDSCINCMYERPKHRRVPADKIKQFQNTMEFPTTDEFDYVGTISVFEKESD